MSINERIEVMEARKRQETIPETIIEQEQMKCYGLKCNTCESILECPLQRGIWP